MKPLNWTPPYLGYGEDIIEVSTRDWYIMLYSNLSLTGDQKSHTPSPLITESWLIGVILCRLSRTLSSSKMSALTLLISSSFFWSQPCCKGCYYGHHHHRHRCCHCRHRQYANNVVGVIVIISILVVIIVVVIVIVVLFIVPVVEFNCLIREEVTAKQLLMVNPS